MRAVLILLLAASSAVGQVSSTQAGAASAPATVPKGQVDNSTVKPEDKCTIDGKVLNAATGQPLKKAHVSLRRMDSTTVNAAPYGAMTDPTGHFTILNVDPGRYHLSADRTGYVRSDMSSRKLKTVPDTLTLSAAQKLGDVEMRLTPQAVVTGRVVDEDNEPVANVSIQILRYRYMNGKKSLMPQGMSNTNDKGEFRAFGLAGGKYLISATYRQNFGGPTEIRSDTAPEDAYVPTYYPNALDPGSAIQVNVAEGTEVSGIDIRLARAKTFQLSGTVTNPAKASSTVEVMLIKRDGENVQPFNFSSIKRAMTDPKGHFLLRGVMPGTYDVQAIEYSSEQQRLARVQVNVGDGNVDGVQLTFATNPEVTGMIKVENGPEQAQQNTADTAASLHVFLNPEPSGPMFGGLGGDVHEDGTFTLKNLMPQKYRVNLYPLQADAYVKQIVVGETESVDGRVDFSGGVEGQQIKIVVSTNGGHVEGSVLDSKQQASPHATVVLVPDRTDATPRYRTGTTDQNGHYVLRGVPAGKYKLYAFDQIDTGAAYDVDYMRAFESKGEAVELAEGAQLTHDLTLIVNEEEGAAR